MFAKAPETISVLEVYEMFEGPVTITPCFLGTPICKPGSCLLKGLNEKISDIIQSELSHLKIADLEVASHEIS
jgi:DNA-binding IscR family transcriptional regulator